MALLELDMVAAKLTRGLGSRLSTDQNWRLSLTAKLAADRELQLSTGEDMKEVVIYANFAAAGEDRIADYVASSAKGQAVSGIVGVLFYFPLDAPRDASDFDPIIPATLIFEIFVSEVVLADLIEFARQGRSPTRLTVEIADGFGMKYGWEPDGSRIEWDTKSSKRIPIREVRIDLTIVEPVAQPEPPLDSTLSAMLRQLLLWQRGVFALGLVMVALLLSRY